jgi:hypothetical protein
MMFEDLMNAPGMVDYGDSDALFIVHVTDKTGNPIPQATMDAEVYFGHEKQGDWRNLPASAQGEIQVFTPYYFHDIRTVIMVVHAEGHMPRMVRLNRTYHGDGDETMRTTQEEWNRVMAIFSQGTYTAKPYGGKVTFTEYYTNRSVDIRHRRIVLRKK